MTWLYKQLIRPVLFTQNPEEIHEQTLAGLGLVGRHALLSEALSACCGAQDLPIDLFGLRFPNPVGLAAGMDKQADALPAWEALGFGFTELGAITWHPQPGNPPPRVFRAVPDDAIVNRMGFNNPGAEAVAQVLARWRESGRWPGHPVGMNLGKSKVTPLANAAEDYANSLRVLLPHLDFFVVNVSSPNTPNLRELQDKAALAEILTAMNEVLAGASTEDKRHVPVLVKVAPDLSFEALDQILSLATSHHVAGIIATNTTIARPENPAPELAAVYAETGGLSGRPLAARSTEVVRHIYRQTAGKLPVIGVGGIFTAADAWEKLTSGASLVQVYTGLVYEGPGAVRAIVEGLARLLQENGLRTIAETVGLAHKSKLPRP